MNTSEGDGTMSMQEALAYRRAWQAAEAERVRQEYLRLLEEHERLLGKYYD